MNEMATVIINKCDISMKIGDYFQYPKIDLFIYPEGYGKLAKDTRNEQFWVSMMRTNQPFDFAENKNLTSKPICWTNVPAKLSKCLAISRETIEETQMTLLYNSL